jgi:hypothetical protein
VFVCLIGWLLGCSPHVWWVGCWILLVVRCSVVGFLDLRRVRIGLSIAQPLCLRGASSSLCWVVGLHGCGWSCCLDFVNSSSRCSDRLSSPLISFTSSYVVSSAIAASCSRRAAHRLCCVCLIVPCLVAVCALFVLCLCFVVSRSSDDLWVSSVASFPLSLLFFRGDLFDCWSLELGFVL